MTRLEIEPLDEGYIIRFGDKEYAKESHVSMLDKIVDLLGIPNVVIIEHTQEPTKTEDDTKKKDNIEPIIKEPDELETKITEPPVNQDDIKISTKFHELNPVVKKDLKEYVDIGLTGMGYHNQGNGRIVICHGTTKVSTSWDDMFALPVNVVTESVMHLNTIKQSTIKKFRKWMSNNPGKIPAGADPDEVFRKQLPTQDTKEPGDYENTSGRYTDE